MVQRKLCDSQPVVGQIVGNDERLSVLTEKLTRPH